MNPSDDPVSDEGFAEKPRKPEPGVRGFFAEGSEEFGRKTRPDFPERVRSSIFGRDVGFPPGGFVSVDSAMVGFGVAAFSVLEVVKKQNY